jgi:hypothetical protein
VGDSQPSIESFDSLKMQWDGSLFSALALNCKDAVLTAALEITGPELDQLAHAASAIRQNAQNRPVADANRRVRVWSVKKSPTIGRR